MVLVLFMLFELLFYYVLKNVIRLTKLLEEKKEGNKSRTHIKMKIEW